MEDAVISDIENYFHEQFASLWLFSDDSQPKYKAQLLDDITGMAVIVRTYRPDYDIDRFYINCGWIGTHPIHMPNDIVEMIKESSRG